MRCKEVIQAQVLVVDGGGESSVISAEVYYHKAGRCRAKYNHLDIVVPSSSKYADLLQRGTYKAVVIGNKLVINLSKLVGGYKLIIVLKRSTFSSNIRYLTRLRRSLKNSNIKLVVRLPKNVEVVHSGS